MEIRGYKTKFNVEDVVYFMYENEISKGVITGIELKFEEKVYIHGSYIQSVVSKIKNFFDKHEYETKEFYRIDKVQKDDSFYCAIAGYFHPEELASSKEELCKMLCK